MELHQKKYRFLREWLPWTLTTLFLVSLAAAALLQSGGQAFHRNTVQADYHTEVVTIFPQLLLFLAALLTVSFAVTFYSARRDLTLGRFFLPAVMLMGISMVFQSYAARGSGALKHNLILLLGLGLMILTAFAAQLDPGKKGCWILLALSAGVVLLNLLGQNINGNRAWLRLAGFSFQPGELLKVLLLITFALSLPYIESDSRFRLAYGIMSISSLLSMVLIGDFGNAAILLFLCLLILFHYRPKLGVLCSCLTIGLIPLAYFTLDRVSSRINMVLSVMASPENESYHQMRRILLACLRSGLLGTGTNEGVYTPATYIANANDDYAFLACIAVFGSALGLVILGAFLVLAVNAARSKDGSPHRQLLRRLCCAALLLQALVHVAGTLNLSPFAGITIPFLSAGGTSTICCALVVGLLLSTCLSLRAQSDLQHKTSHLLHVIQSRLHAIKKGCLP